jgi:uncharacterized membrane-anchored protein
MRSTGKETRMSDYAKLLRYYRDENKPFPLPQLDGMYVRPRYAIHQHELDELLNAVANLIRERDEAKRERDEALEYTQAIRDHCMKERDEARAKAIEEAAAVVTEHYQSLCQEHRLLLVNRANAILALKDKP